MFTPHRTSVWKNNLINYILIKILLFIVNALFLLSMILRTAKAESLLEGSSKIFFLNLSLESKCHLFSIYHNFDFSLILFQIIITITIVKLGKSKRTYYVNIDWITKNKYFLITNPQSWWNLYPSVFKYYSLIYIFGRSIKFVKLYAIVSTTCDG